MESHLRNREENLASLSLQVNIKEKMNGIRISLWIFTLKFLTYSWCNVDFRLWEADCFVEIVVPSMFIWSYVLWAKIVGTAPGFNFFEFFPYWGINSNFKSLSKQSSWKWSLQSLRSPGTKLLIFHFDLCCVTKEWFKKIHRYHSS